MHSSSEQRGSFRIQMPEGQKYAALRVDGRSVDVQLVDASATGVAIACPLTVTLDIDDRAELHTCTGGGLIRIVRKEVFSDGILLGAERLGELAESAGFLSQLGDAVLWPLRAFQASSLLGKVGIVAATLALGGGCAVYCCWDSIKRPSTEAA